MQFNQSYFLTEKGENILNKGTHSNSASDEILIIIGTPEFQFCKAIGDSAILKQDAGKYVPDAKTANAIWNSCISHKFIQYNPAKKAFSVHTDPSSIKKCVISQLLADYDNSIKDALNQAINNKLDNVKNLIDKGYIGEQYVLIFFERLK